MKSVDECLDILKHKKEYLDEHNLRNICELVKEILCKENNVQVVFSPVTLCGDIHG